MKYLKVFTSVITGSMGGRDDGYPCTEYVVYDDIERLAKNYGTKKDERYYNLKEIDQEKLKDEIMKVKKEIKEKEQEERLRKKEEQYELLKKELGK